MIYDFTNGTTAKFIEDELNMKIQKSSAFHFIPVSKINYNKIISEKGKFFYKSGDDKFLMFAYKSSYNTLLNKFPRYHTCQCKTRQEYSGFEFTAQMPVEIFCRDQQKTLDKPIMLDLCKNCKIEMRNSLFSFLGGSKTWYDYILDYANDNEFTSIDCKKDGYIHLWRQISEAKRESVNWYCEECGISLQEIPKRLFLEVHHIDKKPLNNKRKNLKSLCVLCHANHHIKNYNSGDNLLKIQHFINTYNEAIKRYNQKSLIFWVERIVEAESQK